MLLGHAVGGLEDGCHVFSRQDSAGWLLSSATKSPQSSSQPPRTGKGCRRVHKTCRRQREGGGVIDQAATTAMARGGTSRRFFMPRLEPGQSQTTRWLTEAGASQQANERVPHKHEQVGCQSVCKVMIKVHLAGIHHVEQFRQNSISRARKTFMTRGISKMAQRSVSTKRRKLHP